MQGAAEIPGDIAGPALRVTVRIDNDTSAELVLGGVVVNAYLGADRRPASLLSGPGTRAFPKSVDAGEQATGVFVFRVPVADRASTVFEVDLSSTGQPVIFTGRP